MGSRPRRRERVLGFEWDEEGFGEEGERRWDSERRRWRAMSFFRFARVSSFSAAVGEGLVGVLEGRRGEAVEVGGLVVCSGMLLVSHFLMIDG